jgi:TP901 family phage tail tape measure protein
MVAPINLQANVQIQNLSQMQREIQQATQNLKINMGGGNAARSLSALSQPLGRLTGQADEFSKSLDAANARVLAFGASVGIVNTLSNAFKSLINSTIEVEKAITAISVVGDQFTGKSKQLSQGLFSIAKATGQSFEEVSKAALEFSRQGLKLEDTLQRTQDALILTRLTGLDASKSVDGLTASVNAFAKAGLSTSQVLNKLAAVDQAFAVSSADLIEGFNRSAAVAQNAGVTFDELAGIITALQQETSRGGAVIGNALKTIFTRIQDEGTLEKLSGLGIAVTDVQKRILPARQILQNLANDVEGLGKITQSGIFKDVAGTFQINQLISLVGDLGRANSVTAKATQTSAGATREAFTANEKLNQSLDAIINKVSLTGKQLGSLLGEIGLGDNLKGILDGINSFLEGASNLLQGDDLGSRFAKGIVKGIGSVLTGPGIGLFLAIIAKLSFDLAKFGVQSLKTFFNIGQAAKEQKLVQESIVQTLIRNQSVLSQIVNTQGGQNAQAQAFLNILRQEEQALQNIRTLAGGIAAPVIAQGYRPSPQGLSRSGSAAGGYLPAQEASDVRRGVGGASPSSKVVSIPNFAFGGGKRGTMIANTSEYIVPNYAGGGSAIFNQDMVKTMGLPPGAKKITASGGFVPNFAIRGLASNVPVLAGRVFESLIRNDKYIDLTENLIRPDIPKGKPYGEAEAKLSVKAALNDNNFGPKKGKGNIVVVPKDASKEYDEQLKEKKGSQIIRARSDKFLRNNIFKTTREILARESAKKSTYSKIPLTGAGGYIPNFANYIFDSDRLGNSSTKILDAILASPAKKNLLSAPAGAGKSTYAASMGKFIKSISDVLNVSENDYFTILSGAGLTEAGAMSVGFSEILASVNESGGKVSYLNVPDEEIKSRRFSRLGSTNDLRNEAQLRATINAPLNEPKFVDYLKGGAKNFDLINEDDKNDQLAVLGLYGNNGKINGSPVYTLESQRPELFKDIKANLQKNVVKLVRGYASRISKSVGVPVIGKDIEKSLNQIPSLSGFMFEDILNQLAGPNFDSNKISGGSRADFPLNDELKRVFGVSGSQKYAEIKLNPFSSDAISSVIAKQRALARGAIAPKEFDPVQVAKWRETAIGIKLGMGGKRAKEASGIRSRLAREMIEAGAIQSYTKQDAETAAIKKYLGLASGGYIPNFASDALQAAISRERSAGISASQIYVDQSPALKSAANPMGLMVANRRDEPAGGFQGISRARREGMNPKTYGAARGFVPNYAPVQAANLGTYSKNIDKNLATFADLINKLNKELSENKITFDKAQDAVDDFVKTIKSGGKLLDPSRKRGKQLAEAGKSRLEAPTSNAPTGQFADLAGKLVVAQTAMSFFTGAVEGSGGQLEKLGTSITQVAGSLGQLFFLLSSLKGGQALIGKFTDKLKGFGNSIKGALPNLLGAKGAASRAGGLVSGIGTKLPGIGVALTAGYVIKTLADGVKGFFTKDLSATFDGLEEAASVASSQLTDFGKTLASDEIRAASSNFFASFENSILEFLTAGTADITSFIDNAGQKRTIESLGTANEEQLGKIVNDLITANIATGNATARTSAFNFLENLPGNTKGNYGQTKINFEDPKLIEALKDEFKRLGIEAEAYNKKQAFATAQKFAKQETEALIDKLQINKNLISALNSQYQALRDTVLNIDLESVFSKSANKTLLDLNSSFSSAEKSIGEFKNSLSEIKIDFEADKAKALAAELEKINTIASDSLAKLGAEVTNETSTAITGLQNIFSDTTKNADDLRNFLTQNAKDLVNIIDTEEAIKQFEAYRKQSLELERQVKIKQFQTKLDFTNKTLIDQQTLSIQKQNSVLDKQLSIIDKRISMQDKELELTRRIEDTQFERGLVGKSEPAKIQAQITRERGTLIDRAIQDVLNDFKRQIIDGFKEISIPENISPDQALTFRQRIKGGVETISGLARESGETPEQFGQRIAGQYSSLATKLAQDIQNAEQKASEIALDKATLTGDLFNNSVETAGVNFQQLVVQAGNKLAEVIDSINQKVVENNQANIEVEKSNLRQMLTGASLGLANPNLSQKEKIKLSELTESYSKRLSDLESKYPTNLTSQQQQPNAIQSTSPATKPPQINNLNNQQDLLNILESQRAAILQKLTTASRESNAADKETIKINANTGNLVKVLQAITEESNTRLAEFSQSLSEIGDSAQILSQRIRDYFIGLPAELAGLQFGALQSTSPDDLASNLIQQDVLLKNKGSEKENVESIAEQTALRQKSFELATAESASRRRELEIELQYLEEFFDLKQRTANLSEEDRIKELAALKRRQIEEQRTFGAGLGRGFAQLETDVDNFQSQLGEQIPQLFSDNLAQGLNDAISGAKSLKDALRDAATSFFQEITRQNISNLAKMFTSGIGNVAKGFASGGLISGGSGVKDDVPAMLMGGEYVIKKSSVQKYGSKFLDSLNRGSIKGFASGGGVQSGSGGFYAPGEYGTGGIRGKRELLSFATQSFSSGQYDTMGGFGMSGASVSLEAESSRLSQFGRQNNPMFERVQESKQQAFDVYLNQLKQEEQYQEQLKEMERRDKERQKQLITSIVSAVVTSAVSAGAQRAKIGVENQAALDKLSGESSGFLSSLKGAGKGLFTSFGNSLSGEALTVRSITNPAFALQNNSFIGSGRGVLEAASALSMPSSYSQGNLITGGNLSTNNYGGNLYPTRNQTISSVPISDAELRRAERVQADLYGSSYMRRYANGGPIFGGSGVRDDVPAMLTGGEFVLNNRATRKLGVQNLNRLNAGETNTGEGDSSAVTESLISKLDELIQATRESAGDNVVVNVSSNEAQAKTENTNGNEKELQRKIKQAVLDVIAQEKRLGGSLTKGK